MVAALGLFRHCRRMPVEAVLRYTNGSQANPPVVTLLKSAAIGDTVMLSAIVRDLRAALPSCTLRIACGSSNAALARMTEGIDEVIVLPMAKPLQLWRLRRRLRSDVFIDFDSWPRINALIAFCSGSSVTVGFRTPGQHRHSLYDLAIDHSISRHEVENYRQLVQSLVRVGGGTNEGTAPQPWLRVPDASASAAEPTGWARTLVFHMHSGGSQAHFKEWRKDLWAELAHRMFSLGFEVRLSGGPADLERNLAFVGSFGQDARISVLPVTGLPQLAASLKGCAAVVTVDTGIAHLAGAVGAPTLVLHGPTAPERWGALGPNVRCLKDPQTPWIQLGFEVCRTGKPVRLTLEEVQAAVIETVADGVRARRASSS